MNILHKWFSNVEVPKWVYEEQWICAYWYVILACSDWILFGYYVGFNRNAFIDMLLKLVFYEIVWDLMCMVLIENY